MKRALLLASAVVATVLAAVVIFFLWASSAHLPESKLAQTKTYAAPADTTLPDTLTVTTYNIGYLSGMTNNEPVLRSESLFVANMHEVVEHFRAVEPDVVGLQEVDFGAARSFYAHQLDTLATRLRFPAAAQAVNWDERYLPFPYGAPSVHFGRILSGQALLSQFPLHRHRRTVLARPPMPFYRDAFYLDRLAQTVVLDVGGHALGLINVHLDAFDADTRERQARTVNAIYDRMRQRGIPTIVMGDFNSSLAAPASEDRAETDSTMHFLLEETSLQAAAGPLDAATSHPTYPADDPVRRIDYIFYPSQNVRPTDVSYWCGAPQPPSDHCAVTASLVPTGKIDEWPSIGSAPR